MSGYEVDIIQWKVEVSPGQTEILNGTAQEVYDQILEINPDFILAEPDEADLEARGVQKRAVHCGNWPLADKGRIQEGINYLRGVGGQPFHGPGPGKCGRVSCSYNAAIWWCNDVSMARGLFIVLLLIFPFNTKNTGAIVLDSFNAIANSAQHTVNTCAPSVNQVSGQNFEASNWNTIVRSDSC